MDLWMTFKVQDTATIHLPFSSQRMDNFYCCEAECVPRDNSNLMSCEPGCWATQQPGIDGLRGKNVFSLGRNDQIAL